MFDLLAEDGGNNRIEVPKKDYSKIIIGILSFVVVLVFYSLEIRHFNNIFDVKKMLLIGAIVGLLVGLGIGYKLRHHGEEPIEVFQIYFIVTILSIIVMPLLVSLSNRWFSFQPITMEKVEFVESGGYFSSRFGNAGEPQVDGYHTYIIRNGALKRLDSKKHPFPNAQKGQTVGLPIRKGLWGFSEVMLSANPTREE